MTEDRPEILVSRAAASGWQGCDGRELELSRAAFDINDIIVMGKKREMTAGQKGCGRTAGGKTR